MGLVLNGRRSGSNSEVKEEMIMRKRKIGFVAAAVLLLSLSVMAAGSDAEVRVGVGIDLPVYTFAAPPPLVVIPGTYAYFAPEARIDIVFYDGYWYRPHNGRWFRARGYDGPWTHVSRVPRTIVDLPPDYRVIYRRYPRIEYRDFHRHWKKWERDRHWEHDRRWREGRPHGHRGR
jgi:hypothetical protein